MIGLLIGGDRGELRPVQVPADDPAAEVEFRFGRLRRGEGLVVGAAGGRVGDRIAHAHRKAVALAAQGEAVQLDVEVGRNLEQQRGPAMQHAVVAEVLPAVTRIIDETGVVLGDAHRPQGDPVAQGRVERRAEARRPARRGRRRRLRPRPGRRARSRLGVSVMYLRVPPSALAPNSVPCGPLSTSTRCRSKSPMLIAWAPDPNGVLDPIATSSR